MGIDSEIDPNQSYFNIKTGELKEPNTLDKYSDNGEEEYEDRA